jgi:dihydroorotate dehydrogenase (NAD+) catalytic subunit
MARAIDGLAGVAGLEVHVGCRDLRGRRGSGGRARSDEPGEATRLVAAVRAETDLPVLAKLGDVGPDPGEVAAAAVDGGADAIAAIGGLPARGIDLGERRPALGSGAGWLSGPPILPVAVDIVARVARAVRVPVIGIGGVAVIEDVLAMLMAGSTAVGLATAVLRDPSLPGRLALELEAWCRTEGVASIDALVGAAAPRAGRRTRGR